MMIFRNFRYGKFILFLIIIFYSNFVLSSSFIAQGRFTSEGFIDRVSIGMSKSQVMHLLGDPTFMFDDNINCFCYVYTYIPENINKRIIKSGSIVCFEDDSLKIKERLL